MEQANLFGVSLKKAEAEKPKEKPKAEFPTVSLTKGLNRNEATADSVFWHRILANGAIRSAKPRVFLRVLGNEISLKKGVKDSYKAIQDSIVKSSF